MALPRITDPIRQIDHEIQKIFDAIETVLAPGGGGALGDPGSNGIVVRTLAGVTSARTLQQPLAGLSITNATGVGGDPTFALANDLAALEGLSGTGFAKRTGSDAWALSGIVAGDLPGSFSGFANPTAQVGLTPVNGAATTAMRSDAAPALDQSISPTWTGAHIFSVAVNLFDGSFISRSKNAATSFDVTNLNNSVAAEASVSVNSFNSRQARLYSANGGTVLTSGSAGIMASGAGLTKLLLSTSGVANAPVVIGVGDTEIAQFTTSGLAFTDNVLGEPLTVAGVGNLILRGTGSGNVTIKPASAAGTWTWTVPVDDGTVGQVLQTDGSGITSWATLSYVSSTLADGQIYIGNASNIATAVTPSGDVTISNAGVTAIGALKVTNGMLAGGIDLTIKVTGILLEANFPALTGDVATSAGSLTTAIGALKVTNAMIANSTIDLTAKVTAVLPKANGGTGVNNAGNITVGADTTISGGGTIALGGFTFTVPATGTAVLTSRTITEGAGLAGNAYDLSANRTLALGTPSTLSISSANSASGTTHTHAINATSAPGIASSLLATDGLGNLQLNRLTLTDYLFINTPTANLFLKDGSTGFRSSSTTVVNPQPGNSFRNTSYVSGISGWNINDAGDLEANNITARGELRASVFKVNEIAATAGTFGVFYSASTLNSPATTPGALLSTFVFGAKNSDAGGSLFAVGDRIRIKAFTGSGIADAWANVESLVNNTTYTTYTTTYRSGALNTTFPAGTAVVDYGPSGAGFITLSADGTVGSSPNLTMGTHAGSPWSSQTILTRLGNLNGSYGYATDIYGWGAGQYGVSGQSWVTIETTNGFRLGNNTTTRVQLATDGSGFLANSLIAWDTSGNLTVTGNAVIGGWTIGATSIVSSGGIGIISSATPASNQIYTGNGVYGGTGTGFYMDGSGRFSLKDKLTWDGTTLNITGGGIFSGELSAATGTFAGSLSAATGTFAGSLSAATGTFAGSLSAVTGTFAGSLSAATGTFSGSLSAASGTFTGDLTGTNMALTGKLTMSGAASVIAIGATSASAGTGLWIDEAGIVGLESDVQQARWDVATGKIVAGQDDVVSIGRDGIQIKANASYTGSSIQWLNASAVAIGELTSYSTGGPTTSNTYLNSHLPSGVSTGLSTLTLIASNASATGTAPQIVIEHHSTSHAISPNKKYLRLTATDGVLVSNNLSIGGNLLLPSAGVINFNTGDVTITHAANALAFAGASSGYSFDANVLIGGGTGNRLSVRDTGAAQALFYGYSAVDSAARDDSGTIYIGNNTSFNGRIDYYGGSAVLTIENSYDDAAGDIRFRTRTAGTPVTPLTLKGSGVIQLNTYGAGTLTTDASGNITASSDERLKTQVRIFDRGIESLMLIKPAIVFRWNALSGLDPRDLNVGWTAQDMFGAVPEAVGNQDNVRDGRGYYSFLDRPLLATVVNSVQAQQHQIQDHDRELVNLRALVEKQAKEIEALKGAR